MWATSLDCWSVGVGRHVVDHLPVDASLLCLAATHSALAFLVKPRHHLVVVPAYFTWFVSLA